MADDEQSDGAKSAVDLGPADAEDRRAILEEWDQASLPDEYEQEFDYWDRLLHQASIASMRAWREKLPKWSDDGSSSPETVAKLAVADAEALIAALRRGR